MLIDRDNTIISDQGYVHRVNELTILPGAVESLRLVQDRGGAIVIITNQGGIGLGKFSVDDFIEFNANLLQQLDFQGVKIDFVLACPHHPKALKLENQKCNCRKPKADLLNYALDKYKIGSDKFAMFGDADTDIQMASNQNIAGFKISQVRNLYQLTSSWLENL
jgi:D-glycero-D-manno-heptose 1,7-bisphosphate phosphatase